MSAERVYIAKQKHGRYVKVGVTTDLKRRMNAMGLSLILCMEPHQVTARELERQWHNELAECRADFGREWFEITPGFLQWFQRNFDFEEYLLDFHGLRV